MDSGTIRFCDLCQGSVPAGREVIAADGNAYCPACHAKLSAAAMHFVEPAAKKKPSGVKPAASRVSLPAWSLVTACVGMLLLALSIGISVFLFTRLDRLNDRLAGIEREVRALNERDKRLLAALEGASGSDVLKEALQTFKGFGKDYRREVDTTLGEIERGGRRAPDRRTPRRGGDESGSSNP